MMALFENQVWNPFALNIERTIEMTSGAVLELNSFSVSFCQRIAKGKPELDCVGLASSEKQRALLEQAKGTSLNVTFRSDPPTQLCYPSNTFQVAFSIFANRLSPLEPILDEAHRVMTPEGKLLLYVLRSDVRMDQDWMAGGPIVRRIIKHRLKTDAQNEAEVSVFLKNLKSSPFGGGQTMEHGPFLRIELTK